MEVNTNVINVSPTQSNSVTSSQGPNKLCRYKRVSL